MSRHLLWTILLFSSSLYAKIDLVTLPTRDQVQLTIYNAANLTLVREQRTLTLKQGLNRLEFSWAETLIDPTSVYLEAPKHRGQVNLLEVTYPPNVAGSAIWSIDSKVAGEVPVEITFFTSGISWRAFYMGTLSSDMKTMQLQNYVRVDNQSGEDYLNAQTRVVVGKIHLLDEIATLAHRQPPYGRPTSENPPIPQEVGSASEIMMDEMMTRGKMALPMAAPKEIIKESLSEYFIYTIEGTESIPNGWGKRLLSLDVKDIPVQTLYRYDEKRYDQNVQHLLAFKNDQAHHLGDTPLPDGQVTIYRELPENRRLRYVGAMNIQYIPTGQEIELDLGAAQQVKITPTLMDYKTENYLFDNKGNISGFDQVQTWQLNIANNTDLPAEIEIFRHFEHPSWSIQNATDLKAHYEKIDVDTVKYRLTLPAYTKEYLLTYTLTLFEGERQQH